MLKIPKYIDKVFTESLEAAVEETRQKIKKKDIKIGKEIKLYPSGAGSCMRKHFLYRKHAEEKPMDIKGIMFTGLGTCGHSIMQANSMKKFIIKNILIDYPELRKKDIQIEFEHPYKNTYFSGRTDALIRIKSPDGKVTKSIIIDYKFISSNSWSYKFGTKYGKNNATGQYDLQLGTYGMLEEEELDSLGLKSNVWSSHLFVYYFNRGAALNSGLKKLTYVQNDNITKAKEYWDNVIAIINQPEFMPEPGEAITYLKECSYCRFVGVSCTGA